MKKMLLGFFIPLILFWRAVQYWPVTIHIRGSIPEEDFSIQMPLKDKKRLEFFFREVCFLGVWSYTLIGTKPKSIDQYTKPWAAFWKLAKHPDLKDWLLDCFWPPNFRKIFYLFNPEQLKIKLGWETLNEYFHYFPNSRFALNTYENCDSDIVVISVTNKIQYVKVIKKHCEDFQEILQKLAIQPEDLYENEKLRAFSKSLNHDGLIGTVLGYGRENAWLYHKYCETDLRQRPMTSPWPEEQLVNLEVMNQKILSFQPWDLSILFYPRFACDPQSEETKQLKQTYQEEREKILKYYEGKDIVEATLNLFN
jgi:hypothetical protein